MADVRRRIVGRPPYVPNKKTLVPFVAREPTEERHRAGRLGAECLDGLCAVMRRRRVLDGRLLDLGCLGICCCLPQFTPQMYALDDVSDVIHILCDGPNVGPAPPRPVVVGETLDGEDS